MDEDTFGSERDEFEAEQRAERTAEDIADELSEVDAEVVIEDINEKKRPESLIKGCPSILVDYYSK